MNDIIRGEKEFVQNRPELALKIFQSILHKEAKNTRALNNKGVALTRLGQLREAVDCFKAVLRQHTCHADAVYNLISLCLLLRDWNEAEKLISIYAGALTEEDAFGLR